MNIKKIVITIALVIVHNILIAQSFDTLKHLTLQKYSKDLTRVLQDLNEHKIDSDIQELIKNYLIKEYPHLFPPQVIKKIILDAPVYAVAYSSFGLYAFTEPKNGVIHVWDIPTNTVVHVLVGHTSAIRSIAVSKDGKYLLTGSLDNTARLWNLTTGETLVTLKGHTDNVTAVAISPDNSFVFTGSWDGTACMWDTQSGKIMSMISYVNDSITALALSPQDACVIIGTYNSMIYTWNFVTEATVELPREHNDTIIDAAISQDGKCAVIGSWDKMTRVWDLVERKSTASIGHMPAAIAISADGNYSWIGCRSGKIRIVDMHTGKVMYTICKYSNSIKSIALSACGNYALTGSCDKIVLVWDLNYWTRCASLQEVLARIQKYSKSRFMKSCSLM